MNGFIYRFNKNLKTQNSNLTFNAKGDCEVTQEGLRVEQPPALLIKSL